MTAPTHCQRYFEPLPQELLSKPLDYILADHLRQRSLCLLCEQIAEADHFDAERAREAVNYIKSDMVMHVIDEEQDLFPLIRQRAETEDEIDLALGQLSTEHADDERLGTTIVEGLEQTLDEDATSLPEKLAAALRQFAHNQRRHLALENATIMPLAKLRLTERDLKGLAARMAARRGIDLGTT